MVYSIVKVADGKRLGQVEKDHDNSCYTPKSILDWIMRLCAKFAVVHSDAIYLYGVCSAALQKLARESA
jgi:hypothetical protein